MAGTAFAFFGASAESAASAPGSLGVVVLGGAPCRLGGSPCKGQWEGLHTYAICEMENNPFMFETT